MALTALLEGRTEWAPMSPPMTEKEMGDFQAKFSSHPRAHGRAGRHRGLR
ncbi:MAG: hypothetical protein ABIP64_04155 [Burkholderiales bacterium]